jgi:hypothetical protein
MTKKFMFTLAFLGLSALASMNARDAQAEAYQNPQRNLFVQGSCNYSDSDELSYETKVQIINYITSNAVNLCTLIQLCSLARYEDILNDLVDAIIALNPSFAPYRTFIETFLLKDGIDFIIKECNCSQS